MHSFETKPSKLTLVSCVVLMLIFSGCSTPSQQITIAPVEQVPVPDLSSSEAHIRNAKKNIEQRELSTQKRLDDLTKP